jgi:hypothetical protein
MRTFLLLATLLLMLGGAVWGGILVMNATDDEVTGHGWTATVLGVVGSIGLGAGLMALVFLSHRRGYDDRLDAASSVTDSQPR